MKTLKNHFILFDAECPMCSLYTKVLVKGGMLDTDSRVAYQDMQEQNCPQVDRQRAVNEIALVNNKTGEVTYGIRSLFKLFATAIPFLKPLFLFKPFIWLMSKIYAFIAFNRRVIVPPPNPGNKYTLQPSFKLSYRIAYLVFTWAITTYILSVYIHLWNGYLSNGTPYVLVGGLIIFQGIIVSILSTDKRWDYVGNMMTTFFAGALLLLPVLLLSKWFDFNFVFLTGYFILAEGLMLFEHIRRIRLLKLPQALTISWFFYQSVIILVIFWG